MSSLGSLVVNIGANTKEFNKQLGLVNREISRTTGNIQKMGKQLSMAVTLPIAALGVTAVQAFDKQAKAIAQVEAGLKATGGAVGFTSKQLQTMASDLQKTTLFGDEEILQGATAQLLTFTNIAGDQFARTQKAALDLATRLDGDLKGASIQLGKALNDPVANLSALSRSGIQFSEDQKKVIKSLTDTGRLAEAQTLILDELERQYGGSAEAAAKAGTGGIKQLQNAFSDLQEEFGKIIMDFLPPIIDGFKRVVQSFANMSDGTKKMIVVVSGIAAALGPVLMIVPQLVKGFMLMKVALLQGVIPAVMKLNAVLLANPYLLAAAGVAALTAGVYSLATAQTSAEKQQAKLSEKMQDAGREAGAQMSEVMKLTAAVEDETKSEEERINALEKLKSISPEYFGNLDLEKVKMGELKASVDDYRKSLLETARVKAMQKQLEEVTSELLAMEQGADASASSFAKAVAWMTGDSEGLTKRLNKNQRNALVSQQNFLIEQLSSVKSSIDEVTQSGSSVVTPLEPLITDAQEATKEITDLEWAMHNLFLITEDPLTLDLKVRRDNQDMSGGPNIQQIDDDDDLHDDTDYEAMQATVDAYYDNINEKLTNTIMLGETMGAAMGNAFGKIIDGSGDATEAMKSLGKSVLKTALGMARAHAVAVFSSPANPANAATGGLAMPGVIAGGLALVEGLLGAVAFADGGIVSGPTMGLVGEYSGARSNPEVIAPLDKLKSIMGEGGGASDVTVHGSISGNDIELASERGKALLSRTRG